MQKKTDEQIRAEIDDFYSRVESGEVNTKVSPDELYGSLGYDKKLLDTLPEEVRLGLSCGNPLENLFLEKNETLLDLGCGTGIDVFMARLKFPNAGTIYGMDKLPQMINRAETVRDKKGFQNIEFRVGSLIDMPFSENSIDKIISNCVINLEPNKQSVYNEINRILKQGGMFFISDITLKQDLPEEIKSSKDVYGT